MNSELSVFLFLHSNWCMCYEYEQWALFLHSNLSWLCGLGCVCWFLVLSLWQPLLSVSLSLLPLWQRWCQILPLHHSSCLCYINWWALSFPLHDAQKPTSLLWNAICSSHQAVELCIHPLYLMIPAAVSASYAFMIPVATPPNAIAFSYGYLKVYDMVSSH